MREAGSKGQDWVGGSLGFKKGLGKTKKVISELDMKMSPKGLIYPLLFHKNRL